ncbi:hypothetical protein IJT93_03430 [bacterium]|nr:hypothetical protein [bacterium]
MFDDLERMFVILVGFAAFGAFAFLYLVVSVDIWRIMLDEYGTAPWMSVLATAILFQPFMFIHYMQKYWKTN